MHSRSTLCLSLVCALAIAACSKPKPAPPTTESSAKAAAPAPSNVDPALLKELLTLAKTCNIELEPGNLSCPQAEHRTLIGEFVSNQRSRAQSLPTLTAALAHENPAVRVVAANVLYSGFRSAWGAHTSKVAPADAEALLTAVLKLPKPLARQALPASVHAAVLAGSSTMLEAELQKTHESEYRSIAHRHLMTHGRLEAFGKIQELGKSSSLNDVLAALEGPRNMFGWTPSEQAAICPWAAQFLEDPREPVATRAAALLGHCSGEFVDELLGRSERAVSEGRAATTEIAGLRELCAPTRKNQPNRASEEQCTRARRILEKVVDGKSFDTQARTTALVTLASRWPDENTLKLARRCETDSDRSLAEHARRVVQRLEQRGATQRVVAAVKRPLGDSPPIAPIAAPADAPPASPPPEQPPEP